MKAQIISAVTAFPVSTSTFYPCIYPPHPSPKLDCKIELTSSCQLICTAMTSLQLNLQIPTTACSTLQSITSLQQEKAAAVEVAAQCNGKLEATNTKLTTLQIQLAGAEASIVTLGGLLQTESSETDNLRHQLASQAEVCVRQGIGSMLCLDLLTQYGSIASACVCCEWHRLLL